MHQHVDEGTHLRRQMMAMRIDRVHRHLDRPIFRQEAHQATGIEIARSLGLGLDERAVESVKRWRFRPAMQNGKAVPSNAIVEVNFRLL